MYSSFIRWRTCFLQGLRYIYCLLLVMLSEEFKYPISGFESCMLSQQSKYALKAIQYLRTCERAEYQRVDSIAKATGLPGPYLAKVLKPLVEAGILVSRRGKNGGVALVNDKGIAFFSVCRVLEDPIVVAECVLHKKECREASPCAFHEKWSATKEKLIRYLQRELL